MQGMAARETRILAGQVLVAGFEGTEAPDELLRRCATGELGGLILFRRNLGSVHHSSALIAQIAARSPSDLPLLVAVDQEGGRVARLGPPLLKLPPMRQLAALGDVGLTRRAGRLLGRQLAALGFTMDLAPVLDVDTNPQNPVIGDRSFGAEPELVIGQALAFAEGLSEGGVLTCGKHFPGHGDTALDSHLALPRLAHDRARLDRVELPPFRAARGKLDAILTAHVVFDALTGERPATLSRAAVTDLLRGELGFQGLVLTDDMEMKAIADHFGVESAACAAIEAGCDQLLMCSRLDWLGRAHAALIERAESDGGFRARLADAAERSVATRRRRPPRPITDPAALERALAPEETEALTRELSQRLAEVAPRS
jgi:beta-N-acetylhexosaminidase